MLDDPLIKFRALTTFSADPVKARMVAIKRRDRLWGCRSRNCLLERASLRSSRSIMRHWSRYSSLPANHSRSHNHNHNNDNKQEPSFFPTGGGVAADVATRYFSWSRYFDWWGEGKKKKIWGRCLFCLGWVEEVMEFYTPTAHGRCIASSVIHDVWVQMETMSRFGDFFSLLQC